MKPVILDGPEPIRPPSPPAQPNSVSIESSDDVQQAIKEITNNQNLTSLTIEKGVVTNFNKQDLIKAIETAKELNYIEFIVGYI